MSVSVKSGNSKQHKREYEWHISMGWYRGCRAFFWVIFHTLWPLRSSGSQYVPRKGAAVIVSNHLSLIDPFVVGFGAQRIVSFMGKEELFHIPIIGYIVRQLGGFPVDRSRRDAASVRLALTVLKSGELLGMFPEGHRSTTGDMIRVPYRHGATGLSHALAYRARRGCQYQQCHASRTIFAPCAHKRSLWPALRADRIV